MSATNGALLGSVCATTVFVLAPQIAGIYGEPDVVPVLRALSLSFLFLGLGITSLGLLRRQMRFKELASIEVTTSMVAVVVGIAVAMAGGGVWSLVAATLSSSLLGLVLQFSRARHPIRPLFAWRSTRELYASGSRFSVLRLLEFLGRNLDTVAVGRYLSAGTTGVYARAYTLVNLPLTRYLSMAFTKVLFPSFATIQSDRRRLARAFASVMLLTTFVLVSVASGMAAAAPELVATMLGERFADAAPLVPWFALAATLFFLSHTAQLLCESVAELNRTIGVQVSSLVVLVAALATAAAVDGEVWVYAAALTAAEAYRHVAYLLLLHRVIGIGWREVQRAYVPALVAGVVVAGAVTAVRVLLAPIGLPVVLVLVLQIAAAGCAFLASLRLLPFPALRLELRRRLAAVGLLDRSPVVRRVARLLLGPGRGSAGR